MPQPNEFMLKKEEAEDTYQRKLTAGTNITIDPVTNTISAAGGGSTVTYSGTYSYGDSLGALTINGNVSQIKTPNLVPGNNVNITRDAQTGAITISSTGGDDANVEPNPDGEPTDTLSTLGVDGEIIDYYLQEGLIGTSGGSYVTCNLDKNLIEDEYIAVITDADETQYVKTFEYDGTNNVTIQWTDSSKSFTLVITSTTAGLTNYSGAWRNIYCDIYTKSYGQIIYEVGGDKRGLEYFKETPTSLYGESVLSVMTDPRFVFDDQVSATFRAQGGTHTWSVQAGITTGIAQTHVIRSLSANTWQGIFQMSDDPSELGIYYKFVKDNWWDVDSEGTMTWDNCPNAMIYPCSSNVNAYGFKDSFEKDGKTYYLIIIGSNQIDFTTSRVGTYAASTLYLPSYDGTQTAEHGYYRTLGEFGNYLLTTSQSFYYNGLSMDKKLAFFAGGEDENGTDAPIKIYADGTAEGLVTKHDFDNADFTGASSSENGAHGLVPQPLIADKDKFLKGDGTWAEETDAIEELTDVNLTSLADGQILKYNSTTQKWENANESGGTTVVANPTGTATDTLNTISIDGTIYEIEGGGSSGEGTQTDVLFSKTPDNVHEPTITLSNSLFDYDMITIDYVYVGNNTPCHIGHSYMTDDLNIGDNIGFESSRGNTWYSISNNTTLTLAQSQTAWCVVSIIGTKYGSGGSGGGGFDATELYSGTSYSGNITLSESYTNFDYILFTGYATSGTGFLQSNLYKVEDLLVDNNIGVADDGNFSWWKITSTTTLTNNGSVGTYYVKKIYGLKASSGGGNFYKKTTAEYQALPLSDKEDPDIVYFIDDSGAVTEDIDPTDWTNNYQGNMRISIIDNKLTYDWDGNTDIGALSVITTAIPSTVNKIKFKVTTATSYNTTHTPSVDRFKIYIGLRDTNSTTFFDPTQVTWLASTNYNTANSVWENELDLSNVTDSGYLYFYAPGWDLTLDYMQLETASGSTDNYIYYQNIKYADSANTGNVDDVYVNGESVLDTDKIAQVKTHKEVSLAEYEDANDDIIYFVDDDDDELGIYYSPIIYSTEEREVGTWTDGKPLYQRTWVFSTAVTISSNSWQATNIAVADTKIEFITKCKANNTDGQMMNYISATTDNATQTYVMLFNSRTNASMDVKYLTLEYTKSTDTPGSAKYNALGVPMVHYSTDEQVIGTWIDGKPIYRKIYDWTASPFLVRTSWQNTDIDSTNIDRIIGAVGMHQDGTLYSDTCADPTKSSHTRVGIKAWADGYYAYLILEYTKTTD